MFTFALSVKTRVVTITTQVNALTFTSPSLGSRGGRASGDVCTGDVEGEKEEGEEEGEVEEEEETRMRRRSRGRGRQDKADEEEEGAGE